MIYSARESHQLAAPAYARISILIFFIAARAMGPHASELFLRVVLENVLILPPTLYTAERATLL